MEAFQVHILSAERPLYEGPCESLVIPTLDGQYGILAHHCNSIHAVVPGELSYKLPGQPAKTAAVSAGLVKIEDNSVLLLVDTAERPEEIDANRAKRSADQAREELLQKRSLQEYRIAQAQLARAIGRLKVRSAYDRSQNL